MGKVVRVVAAIGIGIAIAVAAPQLGLGLLHLMGASATGIALSAATAISAAVLSAGAGLIMQAVNYAPGDQPSGYRRSFFTLDGNQWVEKQPPAPVQESMSPRKLPWWREPVFFPWELFALVRLSGDCMVPIVPKGSWVIVDRRAVIHPGDLFIFGLDDLFTHYSKEFTWWQRIIAIGMVKRYLGTEPDFGKIIFDCTNPPFLCETGRNRITYAYRVCAVAPSLWSAWKELRRFRRLNT